MDEVSHLFKFEKELLFYIQLIDKVFIFPQQNKRK